MRINQIGSRMFKVDYMSWRDILKRKGAHINRRSMGLNQMGNTIGINQKPVKEDEEE